jgi:hypothetical protein
LAAASIIDQENFMKQKLLALGLMLFFVFAGCDRRQEEVAPNSDHEIQREDDFSQDMFHEDAMPENLPGSTERDAMGTEDAIVD